MRAVIRGRVYFRINDHFVIFLKLLLFTYIISRADRARRRYHVVTRARGCPGVRSAQRSRRLRVRPRRRPIRELQPPPPPSRWFSLGPVFYKFYFYQNAAAVRSVVVVNKYTHTHTHLFTPRVQGVPACAGGRNVNKSRFANESYSQTSNIYG